MMTKNKFCKPGIYWQTGVCFTILFSASSLFLFDDAYGQYGCPGPNDSEISNGSMHYTIEPKHVCDDSPIILRIFESSQQIREIVLSEVADVHLSGLEMVILDGNVYLFWVDSLCGNDSISFIKISQYGSFVGETITTQLSFNNFYLIDVIPSDGDLSILWQSLNYKNHPTMDIACEDNFEESHIYLGYSKMIKDIIQPGVIIDDAIDQDHVRHRYDDSYVLYTPTFSCKKSDENMCNGYQYHNYYDELVKSERKILIYDSQTYDGFEVSALPPPKKLSDLGMDMKILPCKHELTYVFKIDQTQACVSPTTAIELIKRGWADDK